MHSSNTLPSSPGNYNVGIYSHSVISKVEVHRTAIWEPSGAYHDISDTHTYTVRALFSYDLLPLWLTSHLGKPVSKTTPQNRRETGCFLADALTLFAFIPHRLLGCVCSHVRGLQMALVQSKPPVYAPTFALHRLLLTAAITYKTV
jgi:hypothetical protein